ncbi:hypothetical protein [Chryseobacterium sp. M5A1_1a]
MNLTKQKIYNGTIIINRVFNKETANKVLNDGDAGVPFIANPDLVERFKTDASLNQLTKTPSIAQ